MNHVADSPPPASSAAKPDIVTLTPAESFASPQSVYEVCADIWLEASLAGHPFIDGDVWRANKRAMIEHYLPASRVLLALKENGPVGFAATRDERIEALFVLPSHWSGGIGRALLSRLQADHPALALSVYEKNIRAASFYERMGFRPVRRGICPNTGEPELEMRWERGAI